MCHISDGDDCKEERLVLSVIMETICKIVFMVLFTFAMGENTQDMEDITEMMREMNTGLCKAVDQLAETKIELAETKTKLMTNENDLATTNVALNELARKNNELESEITRMRNPPYMHACGYIYFTDIKSATIPYSTLLYSSTNTEGGGLDIASGVFTSSYPGSYTVTWALQAIDDAGQSSVAIYLQQNGQNIEESRHLSYNTRPSGVVSDQGIQHYYPYYIVLTLYCRRQNNCTTPGPGGHSTALL